jgi:hydrogenase-1 operon protein HyaF
MRKFPLPVVGIGPGSQGAGVGPPQVLDMPKEMDTFRMPPLPEPGVARTAGAALAAMRWLHEAARGWTPGSANPRFDAGALAASDLEVVDQILGKGEVAILIGSEQGLRIQESVFAGVWRIRSQRADGAIEQDAIEVGPVPQAALDMARRASSREVPRRELPQGAVGAGPILEEIAHCVSTRRPGDAHVINLSLLPLTPADSAHLGWALSAGPVRILSRGYGSCRITSTVVRDTWWVQYVNGYGKAMVDSIEITEMPEVAAASAEDIADSALRIKEALDWLEQG